MQKLCIICQNPAKYMIKGTAIYYCEDCAKEFFEDISYLVPISEDSSLEVDVFLSDSSND
ncbi:MAG: hypothetical protein QXD62_00135 [Candidatus Woesearchaeota archaeon]